jgi:hypothetical protein
VEGRGRAAKEAATVLRPSSDTIAIIFGACTDGLTAGKFAGEFVVRPRMGCACSHRLSQMLAMAVERKCSDDNPRNHR